MSIPDKPSKTTLETPQPSTQNKGADYAIWRDAVAQILNDRHYFDEAERWDYCDNSPRYKIDRNKSDLPPSATSVWVCSQDSSHDAVLFSPSCDYRICPDCAHRHIARLLNRYVPAIEKQKNAFPNYKLKTMTLTRSIELGKEGFDEAVEKGFEFVKQAMLETVGPNWNKMGAGLIANWEVGPNGKKLHYHMVYLGNYVPHRKLSKVWERLTEGDKVVWVKVVTERDGEWQGAVAECLKYATKFYSEDKETGERKYLEPELTVDLFEAMKGRRRIRSWGSFYNIEPPPERVFCCSDCNSKMFSMPVSYFEIWRETGFTPEGWKSAIKGSLLNLRIADKYTAITGKSDKLLPKSTRLLPGFDAIPIKGTSHYEY